MSQTAFRCSPIDILTVLRCRFRGREIRQQPAKTGVGNTKRHLDAVGLEHLTIEACWIEGGHCVGGCRGGERNSVQKIVAKRNVLFARYTTL